MDTTTRTQSKPEERQTRIAKITGKHTETSREFEIEGALVELIGEDRTGSRDWTIVKITADTVDEIPLAFLKTLNEIDALIFDGLDLISEDDLEDLMEVDPVGSSTTVNTEETILGALSREADHILEHYNAGDLRAEDLLVYRSLYTIAGQLGIRKIYREKWANAQHEMLINDIIRRTR